jgi:hypothetical protein
MRQCRYCSTYRNYIKRVANDEVLMCLPHNATGHGLLAVASAALPAVDRRAGSLHACILASSAAQCALQAVCRLSKIWASGQLVQILTAVCNAVCRPGAGHRCKGRQVQGGSSVGQRSKTGWVSNSRIFPTVQGRSRQES